LSAGAVLLGGQAARADVAVLDAYTDLRTRWCDLITGAGSVDLGKPEFVAALHRMDNVMDVRANDNAGTTTPPAPSSVPGA
jgi:hypothetical protein